MLLLLIKKQKLKNNNFWKNKVKIRLYKLYIKI